MTDATGDPAKPERRRLTLRRLVAAAMVAAGRTLGDGWVHAGNIAYLSLVTLMPLMILIAAVAAAFGDTAAGQEMILTALSALPHRVGSMFRPIVSEVLAARAGYLLWLGGLVALWTVTTFIESLRDIIRRAYAVSPDRTMLGSRLRSVIGLLVAVVLVTLLFISQVLLGLVTSALSHLLSAHILPVNLALSGVLTVSRILTPITLFLTLWALFRLLAPKRCRQCSSWPGALLATIVWLGAGKILLPLLARLGTMGLTYGALSGVMLALLFFYVVGLALVAGAELNAALATARGQREGDQRAGMAASNAS